MEVTGNSAAAKDVAQAHRVLTRCTIYKLIALAAVVVGVYAAINIFAPIFLSANPDYAMYFFTGFCSVRQAFS